MPRSVQLLSALVGLFCVLFVPARAQPKLEEIPLGPYHERGTPPLFSKDGLHIAIPTAKGSHTVVTVDGVEGPRLDRLHQSTVLFSDDGRRHAYLGVAGTDMIVVVDGKEVARAPMQGGVVPLQNLRFSPGGKRFCFQQQEDQGAFTRLVMDGQPGERYQSVQDLVFSPDESRFAYLATKPGDDSGRMNLVVDGKDVGYQGADLQFSPDGQTVVTVGHTPTESVLLMNGKAGSRAKSIRGVHMSKAGINLLVIGKNPGNGGLGEFLGASGKMIPGSECEKIEWVKFSPDGKHYAALCSAATSVKYLLIDGKKGENYEGITDFAFSPDSSRTMFFGRTTTGTFLVIDGEESNAYANFQRPSFGGGGKRAGFIGGVPMSRVSDVVIDGKITKISGAQGLEFSPDGSRYAVIGGDPIMGTLYLDGAEQKGFAVLAPTNPANDIHWLAFSPDGKHVAHHGFVGARDKQGLILDGKLLGPMTQLYRQVVFTPDSQHVFCFSQNPGNGRAMALLVDGQPAVAFDFLPFNNPGVVGNLYPAVMVYSRSSGQAKACTSATA